jgi:uncharacterized protein (DUF697 family)
MNASGTLPRAGMAVKVYVVIQDSNVGGASKILGAKLTRGAAQEIVDTIAGARIEKVIADKA